MGLRKLFRFGQKKSGACDPSGSVGESWDATAPFLPPIHGGPKDIIRTPYPQEPSPPAETSGQAQSSISLQLWRQAYKSIRGKNRELVEAYEGVLNEQALLQGLSGTAFVSGGLAGTTNEQARFGLLLSSAQGGQ